MTREEADVFRKHGCTVITVSDAFLVKLKPQDARPGWLDEVFDQIQASVDKIGIECLRTHGLGHQPYEELLAYGRVLKDGDWRAALRELWTGHGEGI